MENGFMSGMSGSPSFQGGDATSGSDTGAGYANQNAPFTIGGSGISTNSLLAIGGLFVVGLLVWKKF